MATIGAIGEDPARLAELRRAGWAVRSDRGIEVLRYRQGVAVLDHPALEKGTSFQRRLDEIGITEGTEARSWWNDMLVTTEGDRRRALRKPFVKLLRGPHMRTLQEAIGEIVEAALDEIGDLDHVDLMAELAWKIPSRTYCHLVAAPKELSPLAARLSDSTLAPILTSDPSRREESIEAFRTTYDFVRKHLAERGKTELADDFASIMIRQHRDGSQSEEEMIYEGIALLQASVDNTVHQIGLVLATLLEDPARWAAVAADQELVEPSIEEAMRLHPRFGTIFRRASVDTTLDGLELAAGNWVFVSLRSANLDEAEYDDPQSFRFDRGLKRAPQFGGGAYSCLGQMLARIEIQEVARAMCKRYPNARLNAEWTRNVTNAVTEVGNLRASLSGR